MIYNITYYYINKRARNWNGHESRLCKFYGISHYYEIDGSTVHEDHSYSLFCALVWNYID